MTFTDVSPTTQDVDLLLDNVRVSAPAALASAALATSPNLRVASFSNSPAPAQSALVLSLTGSGVLLEGSGPVGQIYRVERSADLESWTALGELRAEADGGIVFEDLTARWFRTGFLPHRSTRSGRSRPRHALTSVTPLNV